MTEFEEKLISVLLGIKKELEESNKSLEAHAECAKDIERSAGIMISLVERIAYK